MTDAEPIARTAVGGSAAIGILNNDEVIGQSLGWRSH